MFNSSVLDVAIGLIFTYLILGLMCTTIHEWIAPLFKMRALVLKSGIESLLNTVASGSARDLAADFYNHALVKSLTTKGGQPSYIPAGTFAKALVDILGGKAPVPAPIASAPLAAVLPMVASPEVARLIASQSQSVAPSPIPAINPLMRVKAEIDNLPESDVKNALGLLLHDADNQLAVFEKSLETWFSEAMDRVSGWYKKRTQIVTALVAALVTIFANADSVTIARKLFVNPTLRDKIVKEASAKNQSAPSPGLTAQESAELGELTGWSQEFMVFHAMKAKSDGKTPAQIDGAASDGSFPGLGLLSGTFFPWLWAIAPTHIFGWFLTAVAASLGAPFWFDTLNKFMNIRAAGTSPDEKGQDRSKA